MDLENKTLNVSSEQIKELRKINSKGVRNYYKIRGDWGKYLVEVGKGLLNSAEKFSKNYFNYFVEGLDAVSKSYFFSG